MRIAVIPARGGSKRIPGKNVRHFCGKPIIGYSIEAALACGLFHRVIVSTDDPKIAEVAREFGAWTPFLRPASLADDHTGTNAVTKHAIRWLQAEGERVEYACCIYATAPFIQERYLREGFDTLTRLGRSFAFSVATFPFPIQRALRIDAAQRITPWYPQYRETRSQDLEEAFHDAGQFYWGTAAAFLDDHILYSEASAPVVLPRHLVQDIDTPEDWTRAEFMYRALVASGEFAGGGLGIPAPP